MPHTILIVDDDPDDIEIMLRVLARSGRNLDICSASSGERGLQYLRECPALPSLVFIDLKMYGMSGIDMIRRIREDERLKHVPLIIVTNSTLESDMQKAYDSGADSFIHKSFNIDQFSRDVAKHLDSWLR